MGLIGQPIDRVDGIAKVTGAARYVAEFDVPGVVHAVLLQSTIAFGSIADVDITRARTMPGVLAIITPDNAITLANKKTAKQSVKGPLLQNDQIIYNGQHVGVVVADTLERAQAAAEAVRITYGAGAPARVVMESTAQAYKPLDFRGGEEDADSSRGAVEPAFRDALVKIDQTYVTPVEHHNPMEPHATIASWDGDRLTVWHTTQGISGTQRTLAGMFGLKLDDVTVICPYVGGGFGSKGNTWPPAVITAMAARIVRRPVKLVLSREQMYYSNGFRPKTIQQLRLAADTTGKLLAIEHHGFSQMSDPSLGEYSEGVAMATNMLYSCQNVSTSHRLVAVHQGFPTYMRAPGESPGMFALESAMDELSYALKMDPLALRLANYAERDEGKDKPFASKALRECYQRAAEAFGWSRRTAEPRSMRDGQALIGWGMASSTYPTNRQPASAAVLIRADGTAVVRSGTQDIGTGTYTIMAQALATELSLPMARVRAELGDSRLPPAPVSGGSMTAVSIIPAVVEAAQAARAALFANARALPQLKTGDLALANGVVTGPDGRATVQQILARAGTDHVEGRSAAKMDAAYKAHSRHAFGAHFVEVRVDEDFGTVKVSRIVSAFDVGRLLNAKTGRSQLLGGLVFGIGMALLEETRVDAASGRYTNGNIADYLVPVNADVPKIEVIAVESPDLATGAMGAKGIGELPMVGAAPAIANAVYHATGVRVRELPIRVEKVLL